LELDIKELFDSINHDLWLKALQSHVKERWLILNLRRWLEAPVQLPNGELQART
jgi:retron-type reverse transcriptase